MRRLHDVRALIAEDPDADDVGRWTGRFSVFVQASRGSNAKRREGPREVSLGEALEWARERAALIDVQIEGGSHYFSAGREREPNYPRLPEPPPVLRPRPEGTSWDGSQQERPWSIESRVVSEGDPEPVRAGIEAALGKAPGMTEYKIAQPDVGSLEVSCQVTGPGESAAVIFVDRLLSSVVDEYGDAYVDRTRCEE